MSDDESESVTLECAQIELSELVNRVQSRRTGRCPPLWSRVGACRGTRILGCKKAGLSQGRPKMRTVVVVLLHQVLTDEGGHLEHRDGLFAIEDDAELFVGVDLGLHLLVLQAVLLDVGPNLLG